jgi:hypothetical protein
MDYAYITREGMNEELRYSIRSVEHFMPAGEVFLFGGKPNWYIGNYTKVLQRGHKYDNARKNLNQICLNDQISDTFVLMNDDFFAKEQVKTIETYHGGSLLKKFELYKQKAPKSGYTRLLGETYTGLRRMGIDDPLDYELHVPMVMTKKGLSEAIQTPYLWRSVYGNLNNIGGEKIQDVKIYSQGYLKGRVQNMSLDQCEYISCDDNSFTLIYKKFLKDTLKSRPTKYEG